ncbi:hypothetical protein LXA43DRAFT_928495 [Ganoderma leucocontextum]|nr:hypothetical protein LXA43DRAFT_928495 [Ganoderma leucocontextum]
MEQESPTVIPSPEFASSMPATDRASVDGLSKDKIQAWALRKSEEYHLSYTMLSLHNAAAPIHTLPTEVLMKVFGQTWHPNYALRSLALPSVCRRWRTVYLSTPEFWADAIPQLNFNGRGDGEYWLPRLGHSYGLHDPPHESVVATLLNRSSPLPIASLHVKQRQGSHQIHPPSVLPSMIVPHLNRVVSLYLEATPLHLRDLHRLLNAGMAPGLERLHIRADEMEPPDLAGMLALPRVSDESLPRLRDLMMPPIFFHLFAVKSLKEVYLDCVQDMSEETMPWPHPAGSESRSLLRTLSRCCNLESLHLEDITQSRWWPPLGHGSGTVQLPSLKMLFFGLAWHAWALAALAALDPCIPSTAAVYFGEFDWDPTMNNLSQLMPSHLVQHHPFDHVVIFLPKSREWSPWVIQCFADQSLRLDIRFESDGALADLRLEDVFRAVFVTHLKIVQGPPKYRNTTTLGGPGLAGDWHVVLRAFPHLTHLTATGANIPSLVVAALGHTTTAHSDIGTSPSTLFPALRYLTLGWEMPGKGVFGPRNLPDGCDPATYRHHDVDTHVERRCSMMQLMLERRRQASMGMGELRALEFYEYERPGKGSKRGNAVKVGRELIASSRRDDGDLPCLARLRTVVGGRVVYRGYLLKVIRHADC